MVQSDVIEIERRRGVIHIIPRFNQQGNDKNNATAGDWGGERISRDENRPGLLMSDFGCAVALVANIAFTHDSQATITPETIRSNPNAADSNRTYFTGNGGIWWVRPLRPLGFTDAHIDSRDTILAATRFTELMDHPDRQHYVVINVNTTGNDPDIPSATDHWVGASELVTRDDIEYFRISPTSENDWDMGTPSNNLTARAIRGWDVQDGNIYVPLTQVRPGFRIYTKP